MPVLPYAGASSVFNAVDVPTRTTSARFPVMISANSGRTTPAGGSRVAFTSPKSVSTPRLNGDENTRASSSTAPVSSTAR